MVIYAALEKHVNLFCPRGGCGVPLAGGSKPGGGNGGSPSTAALKVAVGSRRCFAPVSSCT